MVKSYQAKMVSPTQDKYPDAGDIMSRPFVTINQDTEVFKAIDTLLRKQISGACVVDADGKLVGFLSEKDCLRLVAEVAYHDNRTGGPVTNYMSKKVLTVNIDVGLIQISELFTSNPFRKIPVMDGDKLVGVVRRRDVLRAIQSHEKKKNHSFSKAF